MFLAKLVVCGMLNSHCATIADTAGPQKTREECQARVEQMVDDLFSQAPHLRLHAYDCQPQGIPV